MKAVTKIVWDATKRDNVKGRWLLDSADLPFPNGFKVVQSAFVGFGPNGWAADHHHQRREILLGLAGDLWLIWREPTGRRCEEKLVREDGKLQFFILAPHTPHLVENRSAASDGALYEWADLRDESIPLEGSQSLRRA